MKTAIGIMLCIFFLSSCAYIPTAIHKAQQAADAALNTAEFEYCQAATVGAIKRKFGNDKAKVEAWQTLCNEAEPIYPIADEDLK